MAKKKISKETKYNTLRYTWLVFTCNMISTILSLITIFVFNKLDEPIRQINILTYSVIVFGASLVCGTTIAFFISKSNIKKQKEVDKVIKEVVSGNFDVQIPTKSSENNTIINGVNTMIKELKNVEILKADFVSNFSHEFKTPIVSIKGFSEILLKEKLSKKEQKEFLQIIYDESDRLAKLSNNMLLLTNLEHSIIVPEKVSYSLDEQIKGTLKLFLKQTHEKNLDIKLDLTPTTITANMDMLSQVWVNLISNAIKHSRESGTICISLSTLEDNIIIKVTDNGDGIDGEDIKFIFDKFYQVDKSHSSYGNGLGLPIAKEIVSLHGGEITVDSIKEKSTTFTVKLPL